MVEPEYIPVILMGAVAIFVAAIGAISNYYMNKNNHDFRLIEIKQQHELDDKTTLKREKKQALIEYISFYDAYLNLISLLTKSVLSPNDIELTMSNRDEISDEFHKISMSLIDVHQGSIKDNIYQYYWGCENSKVPNEIENITILFGDIDEKATALKIRLKTRTVPNEEISNEAKELREIVVGIQDEFDEIIKLGFKELNQ